MIVKDNNSSKIKSPCYTKFVRDNHVKVSIKLDMILGETHTIETSIFNSIKRKIETE